MEIIIPTNIYCLLLLFFTIAEAEILKSLLWDPRNKVFEDRCGVKDNHSHIFVNSMSKLTFLCPSQAMVPRRSQSSLSSHSLYENLHIVSKAEFENCQLDPSSNSSSRLLLQCDQPLRLNFLKYFTVVFRQRRASKYDLKFKTNETYYFVGTSDGSKGSLQNAKGGHCKSHNLRLAVTICGWDCSKCKDMCCLDNPSLSPTTSPPTTPSQTTTPPLQMTRSSSPLNALKNNTLDIETHKKNNTIRHVSISNKVGVTQQQSSHGQRTGSEVKLISPVLMFIAGFLLALILTVLIVGFIHHRNTKRRKQNCYGNGCKTQVHQGSPSIHQKGSLRRLLSTSSSNSRHSGTDSL